MRSRVGPPVEDENFYDRERELRRLLEALEGHHVLMSAPRRVGKTSLIRKAAKEWTAKGDRAIQLSGEGVDTEPGLLQRIASQIERPATWTDRVGKLLKKSSQLVGRVQKIAGVELAAAAEKTWQEVWSEEIVPVLAKVQRPVLIVIDELPVLVLRLLDEKRGGSRARAESFLGWFRAARLGEHGEPTGLRWLLAGSVGLRTVVQRHDLSNTVNDLHVERLGAFPPAVADAFLQELADAYKCDLDDPTRKAVLEAVGWPIPFYLQLMFQHLRYRMEDTGRPADPAMVDAVFDELVRNEASLHSWVERLRVELGAVDADHAIALLDRCAQDPDGARRDALRQILFPRVADEAERARLFKFLLGTLENDGYLVRDGERERFRSPLLRAFWLDRLA